MAFTFRQLFNPDTQNGGGVDDSKTQNEKQVGQKINDEEKSSNYQPKINNTGVVNVEVRKDPSGKGTHIVERIVEDYELEEVRKDRSGYEELGFETPAKRANEEYNPSEDVLKRQERQTKEKDRIFKNSNKLIESLITNQKIERIESLAKGNWLEVTYHNTSTVYNIEDVTDGKIKYTTTGNPKPREMTMGALKEIILGPGVSFAVIGDKEKLQLKEFDLMTKEIKEKEKSFDKEASALEQIERMRDILEEYRIPIAYIEPVFSKKEKEYQERLQKQARIEYEEREEVIENIGAILKNGVDKIVIHGNTKENGDDVELEAKFAENVDLDTRGAFFLLGMANGVKYNEGAYTELTQKGQKDNNDTTGEDGVYFNNKEKKDQTTLYIDTSGERLSYEVTDKGKKAYLDHHQKHFSKYPTSATELAYEVLVKNNMLERKPWLDNMVKFITSVDNLTYANHEKFDEGFLAHKWPRSMYALGKNVPFEKIAEWFKEGRDPLNPNFSDKDLDEVIAIKKLKQGSEKVSLRQIIEEQTERIGADISNSKFAIKVMEKRGLKLENDKLGKVIYNKQDRQKEIHEIDKNKNPTNKIYNGFLVAKALGYDTYATYNEKYNRFMVNTNTYNLYPIYEKLKGIVPEAVLVRGVMLMQPPGISNRKDITEEKFLETLGLKDK